MKTKPKMAAVLVGAICLVSLLTACSNAQGPAQTKDFSLADVNSIQVDYDGESVTVKESDTDKITIVEYMDKTKKSYLAKIDLSGGVLTITEGARPIGNAFTPTLRFICRKPIKTAFLSIRRTGAFPQLLRSS